MNGHSGGYWLREIKRSLKLSELMPIISSNNREEADVDLAVVGGGLAGLSLSIQMAHAGYRVILYEKEKYPFHRVCGEYISMESWAFLKELGIPLDDMKLPRIKKLEVTGTDGRTIEHPLPLGGFGISRYKLDVMLSEIATACGVKVCCDTKVTDVRYVNDQHIVESNGKCITATAAAGSFGKRSNLDIKWKRPFTQEKPTALNNYIGVKYHVKTIFPKDRISLHNFSDGYCGISAIEDDKYCLCYLTTAENLRQSGHSIPAMEKKILSVNPHLKEIFRNADFMTKEPVTISQVSFERKSLLHEHMLLTGDAAGMITPLCGNGMSMALHGSKILAGLLTSFLKGQISRIEMEKLYEKEWGSRFSGRLRTGRMIQSMFGKPWVTNGFLSAMKPFPGLLTQLVRQTHGKPF
jgi:flavin-dependent dehydrogenase